MRRALAGCYALLMLMSLAQPSSAIQLRWSGGSTWLTFSQATRCTLMVEADSSEARLPAEWSLLWLTDSCDVRPVALDAQIACVEEQAQVSQVDDPATAADSSAHLLTAHFCSSGQTDATVALYTLDLPAGGRGRLQVVALDPSDPGGTQVLRSNEVGFNGPVEGDYTPTVLSASTSRVASQLIVHAVGSGLGGAISAELVARDDRWQVGLSISERSDSTLTASAEIAANVPASLLQVADSTAVAVAPLAADCSYTPQQATWAPSLPMREAFTQVEKDSMARPVPAGRIQPKDFAFLFAQHKFHLFYIRLNMWDPTYRDSGRADSTEKNFGHAWSSDLVTWNWSSPPRDTTVLQARPGKWDSFHVWAPYIVQTDSLFYMFYTGVGDSTLPDNKHRHNQRLGFATSTDLDNWQRYDAPILSALQVPWALKTPPYDKDHDWGSQQLRDPFVMPDPEFPGRWLMYFVAADSAKGGMAVGVARSRGDLSDWMADEHPIRSTDRDSAHAQRIESPHAFSHAGRWWLFFTPATPDSQGIALKDRIPYSPVVSVHTDSLGDPADTVATHWSAPKDSLYLQYDNGAAMSYWHASEYLHASPHEYIAAWDDWNMGIAVSELVWTSPTSFVVGSPSTSYLGVPLVAATGGSPLSLRLVGSQPARSMIRLRLALPASSRVRVTVFDVAGRRVRTVVDRDLPAGEMLLDWDGRDQSGSLVGSGVYFARLSCSRGERVTKVVLLR